MTSTQPRSVKPLRLLAAGLLASLAAGATTGLIAALANFAISVGRFSDDDPDLTSRTTMVSVLGFFIVTAIGTILSGVLGHIVIAFTRTDKEKRKMIGMFLGGLGGIPVFIFSGVWYVFSDLGTAAVVGFLLLAILTGIVGAAVFFSIRERIVSSNVTDQTPITYPDMPKEWNES